MTSEEIQKAIDFIIATITKCEKMQGKFKVGTSQHSLLKNRIYALEVSLALMQQKDEDTIYGSEELNKALPPIRSILSKTNKAQSKYEVHSKQYERFTPIMEAMQIALEYVEKQIRKETGNE